VTLENKKMQHYTDIVVKQNVEILAENNRLKQMEVN